MIAGFDEWFDGLPDTPSKGHRDDVRYIAELAWVAARDSYADIVRMTATPRALARAAELLLRYAAVIRTCHSSELERFDYLPEVEYAAKTVTAAALYYQRVSSGREAKGESHAGSSPAGIHHDEPLSKLQVRGLTRMRANMAWNEFRDRWSGAHDDYTKQAFLDAVTVIFAACPVPFSWADIDKRMNDGTMTPDDDVTLTVLAVGEPCAGNWELPNAIYGKEKWVCSCGAKRPEDCKTETAKP